MRLLLCMFLMLSLPAVAETYLLVDKATNEIKSMSPRNDAQAESGQEKIILPENWETLPLTDKPSNYKYKNGKFIKNIEKISNAEIKKSKGEKKNKELEKIKQRFLLNTMKELEAEGVKFDEVKHSDFE